MNTKVLLLASAAVLAVGAVVCLFAPAEILSALGQSRHEEGAFLVQLLGAAFLGFAMLDWASHGQTIGGIYGRPLVLANLAHFATSAISLAKAASAASSQRLVIGLAAGVYGLFALAYWIVMSRPAVARG